MMIISMLTKVYMLVVIIFITIYNDQNKDQLLNTFSSSSSSCFIFHNEDKNTEQEQNTISAK